MTNALCISLSHALCTLPCVPDALPYYQDPTAHLSIRLGPYMVWGKDAAVELMAGSVAGSVGKIIEYPFDTTKVRLQAQNALSPKYSGALDCLRTTLKEEGIWGFYRGISAPMVAAAAENATLFTSFDLINRLLPAGDWVGKALVCGSGSGLVASFVLTPVELIKCKIQVTSLSGRLPLTIRQHVLSVFRSEGGLAGFWRGQTGTALREAGGSAAWFGTYHALSGATPGGQPPTAMSVMGAGAAAGVAYNLSLFPADTVKSRMQTESMMGRSRQGFVQTLLTVYFESGVRGLYRGATITCARAAPSSAVIFSMFEFLKSLANPKNAANVH